MASVVYALCAVTSLFCAVLLLRRYHAQPTRILLWTGVGFCGLAVNNVVLFVDFVVVPGADFGLHRTAVAAGALVVMLLGLIRDGA